MRLGNFDSVNLRGPMHVGSEHDPFAIRCKRRVRLELVLMRSHVDQALRMQHAGMNQLALIRSGNTRSVRNRFRGEQIQPLPVFCMCNHVGVAAITDKGATVRSDVEMYGPLVPCQVIPGPGTGGDLIAGQPEILAPWRLQVVPDGAAIGLKNS